MNLAISNIGWAMEDDEKVFELMIKHHFSGLEIAPTRVFAENPYSNLNKAKKWCIKMAECYGFSIPSMQSLWYGRKEMLFGANDERAVLIDYTKKAIDFAAFINCKNIVFGCPRNRITSENMTQQQIDSIAVPFFQELGNYAKMNGTVLALEANPPIYNTNYINTTLSALQLIHKVDSRGFLLNLDIGTMIENGEEPALLDNNVQYINHVHISEPGLKPIKEREIHGEVLKRLREERYHGFISIETGKQDNLLEIENELNYVEELMH